MEVYKIKRIRTLEFSPRCVIEKKKQNKTKQSKQTKKNTNLKDVQFSQWGCVQLQVDSWESWPFSELILMSVLHFTGKEEINFSLSLLLHFHFHLEGYRTWLHYYHYYSTVPRNLSLVLDYFGHSSQTHLNSLRQRKKKKRKILFTTALK